MGWTTPTRRQGEVKEGTEGRSSAQPSCLSAIVDCKGFFSVSYFSHAA